MFQIEIEGFSGPLDLLCHMIDQGRIEAAQISVAEVISIYGAYLAQTGGLPIASVAEFIAQAARLVRQKASSLLPRYEIHKDDGEIAVLDDTENVESLLERYRPYREAVSRLIGLKEKADGAVSAKGKRSIRFSISAIFIRSLCSGSNCWTGGEAHVSNCSTKTTGTTAECRRRSPTKCRWKIVWSACSSV